MNEVARRLKLDARFGKGVIVGLGITIHEVGPSLAITDADFAKVKAHLKVTKYPVGPGGRPRRTPDAASTAAGSN